MAIPVSKPPKLLDQVKRCIRDKHYSLRTEEAYIYWIRWFIRFHGLRHPNEVGAPEVKMFLSYLATERKVAVATHRQAGALLFLYKQVLELELPWLDDVQRPMRLPKLPVVLPPAEVQAVFTNMRGSYQLIAKFLYRTGMRLMERMTLRVKETWISDGVKPRFERVKGSRTGEPCWRSL